MEPPVGPSQSSPLTTPMATLELPHDEIEPYLSRYLNGVQQLERVVVRRAELGPNWIEAVVDIENPQIGSDGRFHVSSVTNDIAMQQVGILFTFARLRTPKDAEIYLLESSWRFRRPITRSTEIPYRIDSIQTSDRARGTTHVGNLTVDNGAFTGAYKWLKPC